MENRPVAISITAGTVLKAVLILIAAWLIFELRDLVLVLLTAIVLASAFEPAVDLLGRWRLPRVLAVLAVYVVLFGTFFGVFYSFVPSLFGDLTTLVTSLPVYLEAFNRWGIFDQYSLVFGAGGVPEISTDALIEGVRNFFGAAGVFGNAFSAIANIFGGVLSFVLIIVFSFYFTVIRTGVDDFLRVVTPRGYQEYVFDLWERSRHKIGLWMQGQLVLAIIIGMLVYLGLLIIGVPNPLLLASLAAAFEIIPLFGPILASIPAITISFASGGLPLALLALGLYVIIHQFENQLIYPLVVKKVIGVSPIVSIIALVAGWELGGLIGIMLSVPIATVIIELFDDFEKNKIEKFERMKVQE